MASTRTPAAVIAAKIAERKAVAEGEIAELRASIADPTARPSWLDTFAEGLQREVAFLATLEEIEFGFAEIDDRSADVQDALVQRMFLLMSISSAAAENTSMSKSVVAGRVAAAKSIARTIADVSHDVARNQL